jgi:tyrosyl-tRNA synthetase
MSIPDELIGHYLRLTTGLATAEIEAVERAASSGELRPDLAKRRMARAIVSLYHGAEAAEAGEERFDRVHREHELPEDVPERPLPADLAGLDRVWVARLLTDVGLTASNSEARRLIEQGGVRIDGDPVADPALELVVADLPGRTLQIGRRRFLRIAPWEGNGD